MSAIARAGALIVRRCGDCDRPARVELVDRRNDSREVYCAQHGSMRLAELERSEADALRRVRP